MSCANLRQGQLQTPQSLSVIWYVLVFVVSGVNIVNGSCRRNDLKVINKLVFPSSLTLRLIR